MPPRPKAVVDEVRNVDRSLDLTGLSTALGFQLRMLDQLVSKKFAAHFQRLEITQTLYAILILLEENPLCRQTDLSVALRMHQPNLVERVNILIERGLIARRTDPSDRRANALELTFAGRHFLKTLSETHDALTADLRAEIGPEVYDKLMALIPQATGLPDRR